MRLQRRLRHDGGPWKCRVHQLLDTGAGKAAYLDHACTGCVALVVIGVQLHTLDGAGTAQTYDRPVVARAPPALRFPSVAHVRGSAGQDEVLPMAEEHVATDHAEAAILQRGQVDGCIADSFLHWPHITVHAKPRHAAIRKDIEPKVREPAGVLRREQVSAVTLERHLGKNRAPDGGRMHQDVHRWRALYLAPLDARAFGIIAAEERGIDDDTAHHAGRAKVDDGPVETGSAAAPGFPPVHPLSALGVDAFAPLRRRCLEQRLLGCEELVVRRDDRTAECFGGEIDEVREVCHHAKALSGGVIVRSVPAGWLSRFPRERRRRLERTSLARLR